jgi:site-specific recombinase XerD
LATQRGHIHTCKRFAAFLKRSPDTATTEDLRRFQLHLSETGLSICNRNRIMTALRFLFRVTLRRLDLAAEICHLREPQKIPQVMSPLLHHGKPLNLACDLAGEPGRQAMTISGHEFVDC